MTAPQDCTLDNPCGMCLDARVYPPPAAFPPWDVRSKGTANPAKTIGNSGVLSGGLTSTDKLIDPRKATPIFSGVMRYFPLALAAVARLSKAGNDKHNPGEPLYWSRDKSTDHGDCIARHQITFEQIDAETGEYHATAVAWRALAQLELLEEAKGKISSGKVKSLWFRGEGKQPDWVRADARIAYRPVWHRGSAALGNPDTDVKHLGWYPDYEYQVTQ